LTELIIGLAIALTTGITWLAYTHPKAYRIIYTPIVSYIPPIFIGSALFKIYYPYSFLKEKLALASEDTQAPSNIQLNVADVKSLLTDYESAFILLVCVAAAVAWLTFIRFLPNLIKASEQGT
jgi:hypothetical protein